ncbi:uncharacterized protein LOC135923529 isoform X2 [Gordionus sp. m RMFG-2023]|uniref:uncharacterized protein LOC135923529 isoform X2 n=1 Tax=Gordionus sp. m RMFG-2023 TaxID=3053472 RepID=UPI0031FDC6D5
MSDTSDETKFFTYNDSMESNFKINSFELHHEEIRAKSMKVMKNPTNHTGSYNKINVKYSDSMYLSSPPSSSQNELRFWFVIMSQSYESKGLAFISRLQNYALSKSKFKIYDPAMSFVYSFEPWIIVKEIEKYLEEDINYQMFLLILPDAKLSMLSSLKNITSSISSQIVLESKVNMNISLRSFVPNMIEKCRIKICGNKKNTKADVLSRLPLNEPEDLIRKCKVYQENMVQVQTFLNTQRDQIKYLTNLDPRLKVIKQYIAEGWPTNHNSYHINMYYTMKHDLSVDNDILLLGERIIIPHQLREILLEKIHEGHPGLPGMKKIARTYVWWPNINKDLAMLCKWCSTLGKREMFLSHEPEIIWPSTKMVGERVHLNLIGPFLDKIWLIAIDSYSRWPEVVGISSTDSQAIINALRDIFVNLGYPKTLVTDDGPRFKSVEFLEYCIRHGIKHLPTSSHSPQSDGLSESFLRTFKNALQDSSPSRIKEDLVNFLLTYRNTPHETTNQTPSNIYLGRTLRRPSIETNSSLTTNENIFRPLFEHGDHQILLTCNTSHPITSQTFSNKYIGTTRRRTLNTSIETNSLPSTNQNIPQTLFEREYDRRPTTSQISYNKYNGESIRQPLNTGIESNSFTTTNQNIPQTPFERGDDHRATTSQISYNKYKWATIRQPLNTGIESNSFTTTNQNIPQTPFEREYDHRDTVSQISYNKYNGATRQPLNTGIETNSFPTTNQNIPQTPFEREYDHRETASQISYNKYKRETLNQPLNTRIETNSFPATNQNIPQTPFEREYDHRDTASQISYNKYNGAARQPLNTGIETNSYPTTNQNIPQTPFEREYDHRKTASQIFYNKYNGEKLNQPLNTRIETNFFPTTNQTISRPLFERGHDRHATASQISYNKYRRMSPSQSLKRLRPIETNPERTTSKSIPQALFEHEDGQVWVTSYPRQVTLRRPLDTIETNPASTNHGNIPRPDFEHGDDQIWVTHNTPHARSHTPSNIYLRRTSKRPLDTLGNTNPPSRTNENILRSYFEHGVDQIRVTCNTTNATTSQIPSNIYPRRTRKTNTAPQSNGNIPRHIYERENDGVWAQTTRQTPRSSHWKTGQVQTKAGKVILYDIKQNRRIRSNSSTRRIKRGRDVR